jgi:acyl-CoA dehydrogenase
MDFAIPAELEELRQRTHRFIHDVVIPYESDRRQTSHGPEEALRAELVGRARALGLLTPHASREMGGLGLSHAAKAVIFEEAGYSPLGPVALNIHAPDEGNVHLLEVVATPAQKKRWLRPLVDGLIRSCFAMTEPAPGAGSDPSMLQTTAVRDGAAYLINGRKWFTTGAAGAAFGIIMARMEDGSASMFLADMDAPGMVIERLMDSLDSCFTGGHAVLRMENLRVPASDVLGELGKGFQYAQVRLAPARLTHCMRWLGAAQRAHDIAVCYAGQREAFNKRLIEHEGVGFMLADNEIDLYASRLAIRHTAWVLDGAHGDTRVGGRESSMSKVLVSEAVWRVVDRAVQVLGGQGVTDETVVARIFRDIRAFRIYDGPSEVHRWSLAKAIAKRASNVCNNPQAY